MRKIQYCVLAGLLAFSVSANDVLATEKTIIVLDASGSMWGQINGKPKLQIAREALATVLEGVSPDRELGLIAYGHREKGNCNDIELIVEPALGTGPAITTAVAKMRFLGKTPLSAAVQKAAEALQYTEEKATVILITDGLENCHADPCALGAELAKKGVDFTAHVVGFDLTDAQGKQVACLAENTGGQYVSANNADELRDALLTTVAQPTKKSVQAELPLTLTLPDALITPDESVAIGADFTVNWTGPNAENDYIDLVPANYKDTHGELAYTYTKEGAPLRLRAPAKPGTYTVRYIWRGVDNKRHVLAEASMQVTDTEVALVAPSTVGAGSFIPVEWKGPGHERDYIDLVPEGAKETSGEVSYAYTASESKVELRAPTKPGNYLLRYVLNATDQKRVLASIPLTITKAEATLSIPRTAEAASVLPVFWTGPASQDDYVDLVPADYKEIGNELTYFWLKDSEDGETGELLVPSKAGEYVVRYILRGAGNSSVVAKESFTVTPVSAQILVPSRIQAGTTLEVTWTGPNRYDDYIDIVPAEYKRRISDELDYFRPRSVDQDEPGELRVPDKAGEYLVRYVLRGSGKASIIASELITVVDE